MGDVNLPLAPRRSTSTHDPGPEPRGRLCRRSFATRRACLRYQYHRTTSLVRVKIKDKLQFHCLPTCCATYGLDYTLEKLPSAHSWRPSRSTRRRHMASSSVDLAVRPTSFAQIPSRCAGELMSEFERTNTDNLRIRIRLRDRSEHGVTTNHSHVTRLILAHPPFVSLQNPKLEAS